MNLATLPQPANTLCTLGGLALSSPALLAPMQGVGAPRLRDLLAYNGQPGMICAPFVRVTALPPNAAWIRGQLHRTGDIPLSVQVLGSHPEHLAEVSAILCDAGVDGVDLNLGCPTRLANRKGVGAALLSQPDLIARIVDQMRAACSARLSVKIRSSEGDLSEVIHLARLIESAGADYLVVHPRTRSQGYTGVADWRMVKELKSALHIPVVGNGDLWYAADARQLMLTTGADAVMIGRPALRNPFIFRQFAELCRGEAPYTPTPNDLVMHLERLIEWAAVDLAERSRGPLGAIKEQIIFVLRAVPEPLRSALAKSALGATSVSALLAAIQQLHEAPMLDLAAHGPLRFETTPDSPT